jgi:hypothetical protein
VSIRIGSTPLCGSCKTSKPSCRRSNRVPAMHGAQQYHGAAPRSGHRPSPSHREAGRRVGRAGAGGLCRGLIGLVEMDAVKPWTRSERIRGEVRHKAGLRGS